MQHKQQQELPASVRCVLALLVTAHVACRKVRPIMTGFRIGQGYDVHAFAEGRELWLGGVQFDHPRGLLGHSDADVLLHAICDALLGAAALGDIGKHFADTDAAYKNIDSKILLERTRELITSEGYHIGNIDATLIAEAPRISKRVPEMVAVIAERLHIAPNQVSIKATTNERLGFLGREEGIAAMAVALLYQD
jgi:2-C-methyl-D-erythritol 2,4-cyclodiphosphate synthase